MASLREYQRKRQFDRTPEPAGAGRHRASQHKSLTFVVQKHAASHLHYDFRLEIEGVLKSWAVPKGPCLDPHEKRLAVEVEDHPLEYGTFEGTIPAGSYGAGSVLLWDRGTWESLEGDPLAAWQAGKLKLRLRGDKLRGDWALIRMATKPRGRKPQRHNWLLIKERDDEARPLADYDILSEEPASVTTGRRIEQVAGSDLPADSKKARMPHHIQPQLATLVSAPPEGDDWLHEIKFDGYRLLAFVEGKQVRLWTRGQQDWTDRFPAIVESLKRLSVKQAVLDGEVVAFEPDGISSFQALQNAFRRQHTDQLHYCLFDLLFLNGHDLRPTRLEDRKAALEELLDNAGKSAVLRYSEHLRGHGAEFFRQAARAGVEGIVSKRRDSKHLAGRGRNWLKIKCLQREEFVIGGYTDSPAAHRPIGALLLGYYDHRKKLRYAGRVGTGFSDKTLHDLQQRFRKLAQHDSSFAAADRSAAGNQAHWLQPKLVAQVEFSNWTRDELVRHASFQGLREDKPAEDVTRDRALSPETAEATRSAEAGGIATDRKRGSRNASSPKRTSRKARPHPPEARKQPSRKSRTAAANSRRSAGKAAGDGRSGQPTTVAGVSLTHADRLLYPEREITKELLAKFYEGIADWILPHLQGRPLSLLRCPQGRPGTCFYQKHPGAAVPAALRRVKIREQSGTGEYVVVDDIAGLVSLVQIGVLEIHPWGARIDNLEKPDRLIFDLDPAPDVPWSRVVAGAREVRDALQKFDLQSFVKTTGGKGLHIVVPLERRGTWPELKEFARSLAEQVRSQAPEAYTTNMSKRARAGRIFIDWLRNDRGATAIAAYSTRAREGAPVATPLRWPEAGPKIPSDHYDIENLPERLQRLKRDPWQGFFELRQRLPRRAF